MAGSILSIGSFNCDIDAAWFTIRRQGIVGNTGRIIKTRNVWDISGRVNGTTIAGVDTKVVALENAIYDGIDVSFSLGSTMFLRSSQCTEGTHIREFTWLTGYDGVRGSGAEAKLRRTFHLVVYGDIVDTTDTDIILWQESLTFIGNGGPQIVPVKSILGQVQPQQLSAYTPMWITQTGIARGMTTVPPAATPAFIGFSGVYYPEGGISFSQLTPTNYGRNENTGFGVRWNHKCWTTSNYYGTPAPTLPF